MASITDIVGKAKAESDLLVRPIRNRYVESTSIQSGKYWRITFPKHNDDLLDCDSIRMHFTLTVSSTDPDVCVDSSDIRTIFSKQRVLCGSQVLFDLSESAQYYQLETHIGQKSTDSEYATASVSLLRCGFLLDRQHPWWPPLRRRQGIHGFSNFV